LIIRGFMVPLGNLAAGLRNSLFFVRREFGRTRCWSGANLVWGLTALAISRLVLANSLLP
jgi:hypothetical protein